MLRGMHPAPEIKEEAPADTKRRKVAPIPTTVPGLILTKVRSRTSYQAHTEDCPSIQQSAQQMPPIPSTEGITVYPFQVQGLTGSYHVEIHADAGGQDIKARCSCPFAGSRLAAQGWCKHAYSIARLLIDPQAEQAELERQRKLAEELAARQRKLLEDRAAARAQQEMEMPTQRERIDYILSKMTPERLQEVVLASVHSVSGLRALVSLLPEDQHPGPTVRRCKRCEKDYDTRYEDVCRTAHPQGEVYGIDIDSKRAEYGCHACGKSFYVSPFWENDGTYSEKTGWCFEGEHDPEDSEEEEEEEDDEDSEEDRRHRYDDSPRRRRRWW